MGKNQLSTIAQTNVNKKVDRLTKFLMAQENKKSERVTLTERKRNKAMIIEDALILYSFVKGNLSEFLKTEGLTNDEISDFLNALKDLYYPLLKDKF